jgi:hypothetical protein
VRWLLAFAKAEIARREERFSDAVACLVNLPLETLHSREEMTRFPELCALLEENGLPTPLPLPYNQGIVARIEATNFLMVYVNNRLVAVPPTGNVAELLVLLLEQRLTASASDLEIALYYHSNDANKRLGELAKRLEKILGWSGSIQYNKSTKIYSLDQSVTWQYDIDEARAKQRFTGEFLKGMKQPPAWVKQTRNRLMALKPLSKP